MRKDYIVRLEIPMGIRVITMGIQLDTQLGKIGRKNRVATTEKEIFGGKDSDYSVEKCCFCSGHVPASGTVA